MTIGFGANKSALAALRQLDKSTLALGRTYERLGSGLRINRASDDAAGLAIGLDLNVRQRTYGQAIRNINDGISLIGITEGALRELGSITIRQLELAEQAANGVYSSKQRAALNKEANALVSEYNRIVEGTTFNDLKLLDGSLQDLSIQTVPGDSASISLRLGSALRRAVGTGSFLAPVTYTTANSVRSNQIVDVNGDGIADFVGGTTNNGLSVLLGNSDGSLQAATVYGSTGITTASDTFVADFNGDGKLDAMLLARDATNFRYYHFFSGNGDGSFNAGVSSYYFNGFTLDEFDIADVNGDNILDMVAVGTDLASITATTFIGNGNGTFRVGPASAIPGTSTLIFPDYNRLADFNGDGLLDMVVGNSGGSPSVVFGTGTGAFTGGVTLSSSFTATNSVLTGDVDGDGDIDIFAAGTSGTAVVQLYLNNGNGTFQTSITLAAAGNVGLTLGDLNDDGKLDLFARGTTYIGNGDGTFNGPITNDVVAWGSVSLVDVNGDDVADVIGSKIIGSGALVSLAITTESPLIGPMDLTSAAGARAELKTLTRQRDRISGELAVLGAYQNRLLAAQETIRATRNEYANAESRIMTADIAEESSDLIRQQILQRSAAQVLSNISTRQSLVLDLIR